jgi:hypothetical protein
VRAEGAVELVAEAGDERRQRLDIRRRRAEVDDASAQDEDAADGRVRDEGLATGLDPA